MAEGLDRMVRKRGTLRGLTTKLLQRIEEEIVKEKLDRDNLEDLIDQLSLKEPLLKKIDEDIENVITNLDMLDEEIEKAQEYQERIVSVKGKAKRRLKNETNDNPEKTSTKSNVTVQLPKLTLEKFYGDPLQWQGFWDQYKSAVHDNPSLSNIDKFCYLRSFLEGRNAIAGLSRTDNNYDAAIKLLSERFGRKDVVLNAHMNQLLSMAPVKNPRDIEKLRALYDRLEVHIRSLSSMGLVTDSYGSLLCPLLLKLIPTDLTMAFSKQQGADTVNNVTALMDFFKTDIECRERALLLANPHLEGSTRQQGDGKSKIDSFVGKEDGHSKKGRIPTTSTFTTTAETKCIYCEDDKHGTYECKKLSVTERKQKLQKQGRCFRCLNIGHLARWCRRRKTCAECGRNHHVTICTESEPKGGGNAEEEQRHAVLSATAKETKALQNKQAYLQTAKGVAVGKEKSMTVRCLFDGGSERTFIKLSVSRYLNLPVVASETLNISTFGGIQVNQKMNRVKLVIRNTSYLDKFIEIEALEIPDICCTSLAVPDKGVKQMLESMKLTIADFDSTDDSDKVISLLIGCDNYWKMTTGKIVRLNDSLVAVETLLGWCVQGYSINKTTHSGLVNVFKTVVQAQEDDLNLQLRTFWELESLGIKDETVTQQEENIAVLENFESSVTFEDGRYQVRLPWKPNNRKLADNFTNAAKRLENMKRKFICDSSFFKSYSEILSEQEETGVIERVIDKEYPQGRVYYMPHRAVLRDSHDTTRMRIVYDASLHGKEAPSLNECLSSGPNLNPDVLSVLLRFREHRFALTADVEKAFLQIALAPEDRDAVRFLWYDDNNFQVENSNFVIFRSTRVVFGLTCSPFLLSATLRHHFDKYRELEPNIVTQLEDSVYVDDFISGADTNDEAILVYEKSRNFLRDAGMNLRKWKTNSKKLHEHWCSQESKPESKPQNQNLSLHTVLGLTWNSDTDQIAFNFQEILEI